MARNQVSMPSRANASLLRGEMIPMDLFVEVCQCPHGLMPHCYRSNYVKESFKECHVSMPSRANASLLQERMTMSFVNYSNRVNALTG